MDVKTLKNIKLKLGREVQKLEKYLKKFKEVANIGSSSDDNAEELEAFSENVDLSKKYKTMLKESKMALTRIEENGYGICAKCKKTINSQRLQAYPAAIFCVECDSKRNRRWWQLFKK